MDTTALQDRLMQRHGRNLVCGAHTDLVVEGFPRSANTFSVDMINVLCRAGQRAPLRMAHHTHIPAQLQLADALGVPVLVLIRDPLEAILSFAIYSERPVTYCLDRYRTFYEAVTALRSPFVVGEFCEVTRDFNAVVAGINRLLTKPIPLSQDLERDAATARAAGLERAQRTHGDRAMRRVGTPDPEREKLKHGLQSAVAEAIAAHTDIRDLYDEVIRRGQR